MWRRGWWPGEEREGFGGGGGGERAEGGDESRV